MKPNLCAFFESRLIEVCPDAQFLSSNRGETSPFVHVSDPSRKPHASTARLLMILSMKKSIGDFKDVRWHRLGSEFASQGTTRWVSIGGRLTFPNIKVTSPTILTPSEGATPSTLATQTMQVRRCVRNFRSGAVSPRHGRLLPTRKCNRATRQSRGCMKYGW